MKTFLITLTAVCAFISTNAQFASLPTHKEETSTISPLYLEVSDFHAVEAPGLKMRRTGSTLTIFGAILFVGGVALASSADALYYNSTTTNGTTVEEGDPKGGIGVVMGAAGLGMMVPGIIFWSKGSKRFKRYQEEQKALVGLNGAGLSVRFKF
jgi:hypothetical protein